MSERLVFELQAIDRATAPLKAVQAQVGATAKSVDAASASMNRFAGATGLADRSTQRWAKGALQQAGFQVGDYFVQIANGTSQMQAFGQQGAQLLGIFGPIGAVLGAGVAIISAIAVAAERAGSGAKTLTDAMKDMDGAMRAHSDASQQSLMTMRQLEEQYGRNAIAARGLFDAQVKIANMDMAQAQTAMVSNLKATVAEVDRLSLVLSLPFQDAEMVQRDIRNLSASIQTNLRMNVQEAMALQSALDSLGTARGPQQIFDAAANIQAALLAATDASGQLPPSLDEAYRAAVALQQMALATGLEINNAADAGDRLGRTNMSEGLYEALTVAQQLALATREALFPKQVGRGGDPRPFESDPYFSGLYFPDPEKMKKPDVAKAGGGSMDPLKRLREQIDLERQLMGMTEAKQQVIKSLGDDWQKYDMSVIDGLAQQISEMEKFKQIGSTIKESFSKAFMSMVDGTKSVKDAFKQMARNIIMELYEVLVVKQLVAGVTGAFGKAFPVLGKALGFMADGGTMQANRPYIVGERGPELMVPGRSSAVIPNDRLGGGAVIVNQTINVSTGVQQTVRAEIKSLMPQIADSAKAAVLDAKRRGGAYGGAFA
jgi:hypothetical protein